MKPERQQLFKDVLTTVVESDSSPWLCCRSVRRDNNNYVIYLRKPEDAEDGTVQWNDVTPDTIELGFRRIMDGSARVGLRHLSNTQMAWNDKDAGIIDAADADCILQAGMFGELVYG